MPGRNGRSRSSGVRWSRMRRLSASVMGCSVWSWPVSPARGRPAVVTCQSWTSFGSTAARKSETMAHSSVRGSPGSASRLRTVRPDGTPVYRYEQRPGAPPVSVACFDTDAAHAALPPDHRHAHDFLVLVYVEEGAGSFAVDGADRPLRPGQVYAVPPGQVVDVTAVFAQSHCRAWSVALHAGRGACPGCGVPAGVDPASTAGHVRPRGGAGSGRRARPGTLVGVADRAWPRSSPIRAVSAPARSWPDS